MLFENVKNVECLYLKNVLCPRLAPKLTNNGSLPDSLFYGGTLDQILEDFSLWKKTFVENINSSKEQQQQSLKSNSEKMEIFASLWNLFSKSLFQVAEFATLKFKLFPNSGFFCKIQFIQQGFSGAITIPSKSKSGFKSRINLPMITHNGGNEKTYLKGNKIQYWI